MPIFITLLEAPDYRREISPQAVALCGLLVDLVGDEPAGQAADVDVPVDVATPLLMDKVLEFLVHHQDNPMRPIEKPIKSNVMTEIVDEWDANFMALEGNQETMVDLILAANYLNCQSLLELGILKIACMIKDKEPDHVKEMFGIDGASTPEQDKQVREANPWVFDLGLQEPKLGAQ